MKRNCDHHIHELLKLKEKLFSSLCPHEPLTEAYASAMRHMFHFLHHKSIFTRPNENTRNGGARP